jgi:putative protein kinase ArgK-like GTPase of G3E family
VRRRPDRRALSRIVAILENGAYGDEAKQVLIDATKPLKVLALGIAGTGGAGKAN